MRRGKPMLENKGITLIALIITIVVLSFLTAVIVNVVANQNVIDVTDDLNNKIVNQEEEHKSISNMVRNLYQN